MRVMLTARSRVGGCTLIRSLSQQVRRLVRALKRVVTGSGHCCKTGRGCGGNGEDPVAVLVGHFLDQYHLRQEVPLKRLT